MAKCHIGNIMFSLFLILWLFGLYVINRYFVMTSFQQDKIHFVYIVFNISYVLQIVSYWKVSFSSPGFFYTFTTQESTNPDSMSRRTFCKKCQHVRPPRTHHCSICNKCVRKMDHHCIFINNCVGEENYGIFVLALLYCFISSISSLYIHICYYMEWMAELGNLNHKYLLAFSFSTTIFFSFATFGLLCITHINISLDRTTIEWYSLSKEGSSNAQSLMDTFKTTNSQSFGKNVYQICGTTNLTKMINPFRNRNGKKCHQPTLLPL